MPAIASLRAKEILDSRGNPTIQVTLTLDDGRTVETSVPNGIRRYPQEAFVLYDQDPNHMEGRGVGKAVALINQTIGPQLVGQDPTQQAQLDAWLLQLDATPQKTQAGANTFAAVSQAILKAGATASNLPLYQCLLNQYQLAETAAIPTCLYGLVNGGQYGTGNLDIQEFLIIPASHSDYRVSLEIESAIRGQLLKVLQQHKANYSTGALGGFTPALQKNSDVFEFIIEAARNTPYILARDFFFGIDSGGDQLVERGKYSLKDKSTAYSEKELLEFYKSLREQYNLTYFEDPFAIKDANSWRTLTGDLSETTRIAGDIITATNPELVKQAVANHLCNTLVVKPSQIGTITETIEAIKIARATGWSIVISQRTGETNDDLLADFAVGVGAEFVKFGPTQRGEAVSKYNRLADIYREIELANAQQGATMIQTNPPADETSSPPMNTPPDLPVATPAAPAATSAPGQIPQTDLSAQLAQPVNVGAIVPPSAAETPVVDLPVNIPPPTTPPAPPVAPASTAPSPVAAPTPTDKPLEANMQQAIDSTLAEIGAVPKPGLPPAQATPASVQPATPTGVTEPPQE